MKPDFSKMTRQELRDYVLTHREDGDVIEALINLGNPHSFKYPFPETEDDFSKMAEILKQRLGSKGETL